MSISRSQKDPESTVEENLKEQDGEQLIDHG